MPPPSPVDCVVQTLSRNLFGSFSFKCFLLQHCGCTLLTVLYDTYVRQYIHYHRTRLRPVFSILYITTLGAY